MNPVSPIELQGGGIIRNTIGAREVGWRDRLRWKLFPAKHCDVPEAPPTHKDCLTHRVTIELSFVDRISVLLSGRLMADSKIVTENTIGNTVSTSTVYPLPPKFLERK